MKQDDGVINARSYEFPPYPFRSSPSLVPPVSGEPQQKEKQVDEIEIER